MTAQGDGSGFSWRDVSYAFVHVEEFADPWDELAAEVEVAIVDMRGERLLHCVVDVSGCLRRSLARSLSEICADVQRAVEGRVVVAHGRRLGWHLIAAACPDLEPLALLDSLSLARGLLPGGHQGLPDLMARLDVRVPNGGAPGAGDEASGAVRNAVALAGIFPRMVERLLPGATVGQLRAVAGGIASEALLELGLEGGQ